MQTLWRREERRRRASRCESSPQLFEDSRRHRDRTSAVGNAARAFGDDNFGRVEIESPNKNVWYVSRALYGDQQVYVVARWEVACEQFAVFEVFSSEDAGMRFVMDYIADSEDYEG